MSVAVAVFFVDPMDTVDFVDPVDYRKCLRELVRGCDWKSWRELVLGGTSKGWRRGR